MNDRSLGARILIADDEPLYLRTTGQLLRKAGYQCECVSDGLTALEKLREDHFDLILSDLNMPGNLKLELLHQGREKWPDVPLIVITGVPSLPTAIESVRLGIADYLLKPVKYEDLLASIERVLANRNHQDQWIRSKIDEPLAGFGPVIGKSSQMVEILETVARVAATDSNVLISGESGTGKEIIAKTIHHQSRRRKYNFQVVDCTSIPEALFESVLFGHAKGAFTGAVSEQPGLMFNSDRGTTFFDELGELPITSQAKLLRTVQEQAYTPLGKNEPVFVDTRYISATNRDIQKEIVDGRFRKDLFYRLAVIHIEMPPLRDRGNDIIELATVFLKELQGENARVAHFSDAVIDRFLMYPWPGNIRELKNVVERAVALSTTDTVLPDDLPKPMQSSKSVTMSEAHALTEISREQALDDADHRYLTALLEKHHGNVAQVAKQAGLSRQGMHKLLAKHGITPAHFRN